MLGNIGLRSCHYRPSAERPIQIQPRANIPQYGPKQVRFYNVVSCLLDAIVSLSNQTLLRLVNVRNLHLPSSNFEW